MQWLKPDVEFVKCFTRARFTNFKGVNLKFRNPKCPLRGGREPRGLSGRGPPFFANIPYTSAICDKFRVWLKSAFKWSNTCILLWTLKQSTGSDQTWDLRGILFTSRECQTFQPFRVNPVQEHKEQRLSTIASEFYSIFHSQSLLVIFLGLWEYGILF